MGPTRWQEVTRIWEAALDVPAEDRAAYLDDACSGDASLRAEVASLLAHDRDDSFLEAASVAPPDDGPALEVGSSFGDYRVTGLVGRGGMGEVWRARDARLERDVALKVLPLESSRDPARLARFEREARMLASMSHPNIGAIYGLASDGARHALVLELITGQTLADRLEKGPLTVPQALDYARQIARALSAAHLKDVQHRDLKPSNVMVGADGLVKVIDFGLARPYKATRSGDRAGSRATAPGALLGTAGYASPEALRGETTDRRTDIWAFGCVLFEMITGRPAFDGTTTADVMAAVMHSEPDWEALPPAAPRDVVRLLRRCLQKAPDQRLHDIDDALLDIEDALAAGGGREAAEPGAGDGSGRTRRWWAAAAMAGWGLALALVLWRSQPAEEGPAAVYRFQISVNTFVTEPMRSLALSPDGRMLALVEERGGAPRISVRDLGEVGLRSVSGTDGAQWPFFSPDGTRLGFAANGALKVVPVEGGTAVTVHDLRPVPLTGASWSTDGGILFSELGAGIQWVSAAGGPAKAVSTLAPGELEHHQAEALPGGTAILYVAWAGPRSSSRVVAQSLVTGERHDLVEGSNPVFVEPARLLFTRDGSLWEVPFDRQSLSVTGPEIRVIEDILQVATRGHVHVGLSRNGTLAYVAEPSVRNTVVSVDRTGRSTSLVREPGRYQFPRLSPDGARLAVTEVAGRGSDLWLHDLERQGRSRLTVDEASLLPAWAPLGDRIAFASTASGWANLFLTGATGEPRRLGARAPFPRLPGAWSPEGRWLAYYEIAPDTGRDVWALEPNGRAVPVAASRFNERGATFSPDGRWIAYVSDESGRDEVYARPFPGPGRPVVVSTSGGQEPVWSATGRELFYRAPGRMMAVPMTTTPALNAGRPVALFEDRFLPDPTLSGGTPNYDVTRDGQRFIMVEPAAPINVTVVLNWRDAAGVRAAAPGS